MSKISAVYKITNTVTGDFYIGSSNDVKRRWKEHKWPSSWKRCSNSQLYQDMQKYGIDKFEFEILAEVEIEKLKEKEQQFIEMLKPTYNSNRANGLDIERRKEYCKEYEKTEKRKKCHKEYEKTEKRKKYKKEYEKTEKRKKYKKEYNNRYTNQLCYYNGETLTLDALRCRFKRMGIDHPVLEAKKYLIKKESKTPIEFYDVYP